jgi:glycine oxidase
MKVLSDDRRVAVVGGGVAGCAVAFELARAGSQVLLFERDEIAAHASGKNAGNLNPLHGTSKALIPMALEAFKIHAEVKVELEHLGSGNYGTLPLNRVHLGYDEADRPDLEETASLYDAHEGFSATWQNGSELRKMEPRLASDVRFAVVTAGGLTVDSCEFTNSLAAGAAKCGAVIVHETVLGVATSGGRVTGILTRQGQTSCDAVVLATGPWVAETRAWFGLDLAITPVKGELLLLEMPDGDIGYDFTWQTACLYRRRGNQVWVGGTQTRSGLDCVPTAEARESLMDGAARIMPSIRQAKLLDHIAAMRPLTPSNEPIASRAEGWENVYIANGGGFKGVLLSVAMARKIRCLLQDEGR